MHAGLGSLSTRKGYYIKIFTKLTLFYISFDR
jgi:hypothetical protein